MKHNGIAPKIRSHNPLAMFATSPVGVAFETQEAGEKIVLLLRAHIITLVPAVLLIIVLLLAPVFVPIVLGAIGFDLGDLLARRQIFWVNFIWYLFTAGFAFYKFIFWYFNVYIVTNERIIDFDFNGILHSETSYTTLNHIEDVSSRVSGFFRTLFNFGHVLVQTAAEESEFEFSNVKRPEEVARIILEQVRHEEAENPGEIS